MAYQMKWTFFSEKYRKECVDYKRLDDWMKKYGYLHKSLNDYTEQELPTLVLQFRAVRDDVCQKK